MSGQYKVAWLCEALLVSRSGYYDWKDRRRQPGPRQMENIRLRERIRQEFARSRQTYGSPRLARRPRKGSELTIDTKKCRKITGASHSEPVGNPTTAHRRFAS
jgi:putative transposase